MSGIPAFHRTVDPAKRISTAMAELTRFEYLLAENNDPDMTEAYENRIRILHLTLTKMRAGKM